MMRKFLAITATQWVRIHLILTCIWTLLALPTILFWKDSILWVAFMSLYANMVGHFSAYQAARAEKNSETSE